MIGYWGYLQFETNDKQFQHPANLERTAEGRYETYYPANSEDRPISVFQGAEVGTMTFTMYLHQKFNEANLKDILADFVIWVNTGFEAELVIGTKSYGFNKWACKKVVEKFTEVTPEGVIMAATLEVTLKEV